MFDSRYRRAAAHAQRRPRSCRLELQGLEQRIVPSWMFDQPVPGAPAATTGPAAYVTPDGTARVVYTDTNLNVDELYLTPDGQPWREDQLVQGAPAAASGPFGYVTPDGTARVVYTDTARHIDELYLQPGGTWQEDQLVQGAPAAVSSPFAYVTPDGTARVVYTDTAGNIDELYLVWLLYTSPSPRD